MVLDQKRLSWTTLSPNSTLRTVILTCLVGALSYLVARLGGALVLRPQMVWPLWPGCAFLVAVLLLAPRRIWAFLMLAGLSGFVVYDLQAGLTLRSIALLILADTVEILVAALGVSYAFDGRPCLNSVKSLAKYLFFAVLLGSLASAFLASVAFGTNYGIRWRIGFFTEALALLTLTPAILSWANVRQRWTRKSRAFYFEAATLAGGLSLLGYVAFLAPGHFGSPALLYSLLPFLLWSSLRFGVSGICTSMVLVALLSIWGAVHGRGPFIGSEPLNNVMSLQLFLFFGATTFMVLAVVVEEQKQSERAFRESEKRFRLVADTAPALIWMADTDKLCAYFNKPWLDFTGRSMEAELGNGWAEGVHPADLQKCMDTYWQAFDRREEFRLEYRLRRHDGEYRWVLDIGVPRFDQHSSFIGYIGCGVDVTERKHAEEALRESEAYLSEAQRLTHTGSGAWQVPGGDALYLSDEWYRIYGFDSKAGLSVWNDRLQRMHPEDRAKVEETKDRAIRGKSDYEVDHRILLPDGTVKYTHTVGHPVLNARGDAEQFVFTMMDVTERKRSEEALSTMSRRLIAAQEQERARIARELHDDIGQRLALLAVELDQLHHDPQNLPEVGSRLGELQKQASEIATGIQTLSHELHSSKRISPLVRRFVKRGIVLTEDLPRFKMAVKSAIQARNSVVAEIVLLVLVYTLGLWIWRSQHALGDPTWYATPAKKLNLTLAGYWYVFVSIPIFQFILLRWYVRLVIWFRLLWQISRLNLHLSAAHPDRAGGIGFLGKSSYAFAPVLFAQGTLLAGVIASRVLYEGRNLLSFKMEAAGLVGFLVLVILGPLVMFAPLLDGTQRRGSAEYGLLANRYVFGFEDRWLRAGEPETDRLLGSADIQAMADMTNVYANVRQMRVVPFGTDDITRLAAATAAPLLPLLLTMFSVAEIVRMLIKIPFR